MSDQVHDQSADENLDNEVINLFEQTQAQADDLPDSDTPVDTPSAPAVDTSTITDAAPQAMSEDPLVNNALVENYTPRELLALSKVSSPDARAIFANIKPSSWTFQLWTEDPDTGFTQSLGTQEADIDERLIGMCQALQRPKPVCHAQPDLLTWLQDNGHTGPIAMEFVELGSRRAARFIYLHIPKATKDNHASTSPYPQAGGQSLGTGTQPLGIFQQMLIQMQQQQAQIQQSQTESAKMIAEIIRESRHEQRELIATLIDKQRAETLNRVENDPMRELGLSMHTHALNQMQEKITDLSQDGLAGVKRTIENGQIAQTELAKMIPEREEKDENWEFFKDLGKDVIRAKLVGGTVASSQQDKLSTMLGQLGAQGNEILNEAN